MGRFKLPSINTDSSPLIQLWWLFQRNHFALVASWVFLFMVAVSILAPIIAPYSPLEQHSDLLFHPPSWHPEGSISHPFGTDSLGRDIFSRTLYGVGYSFGLALIAVAIAVSVGLIIGVFSGFSKGLQASAINNLLDILLIMPSLLIAIVIVAILGTGISNTFWAVVLALLPQFIHQIRIQVSELLTQDFVIAYRLDGANNFQLFRYALLPNMIEKIIITGSMSISSAVLDISILGFIGIGAQSPEPELGTMISDSLGVFYLNPWTVFLPGLILFLCVLSTNIVGDGIALALKQRRLE